MAIVQGIRLRPDAERALRDFFYFAQEVWGLRGLREQPHREITELIQQSEEDDAPNLLLVVPRGCYKTSIAAAAMGWKQLRQIVLFDNVYHRIALASATLALSRKTMGIIENQFRANHAINADYGKMWVSAGRDGGPRSKTIDGIVLGPRIRRGEIAEVSEPSFWIASRRRVSTGFHCDEIFVDDLNNKDNSKDELKREDIKSYFRQLYPILNHTDRSGRPGRFTVSATRWHDDDVPGMIMRQESELKADTPGYVSPWKIIQRAAVLEDGSLYFPEVLTKKVLAKLRDDKNMTTAEFYANYMNDPVGEAAIVKEEDIPWRSRDKFPWPLRRLRATVDPNFHNEAADLGCYAAISVTGFDKWNKLYVVDSIGSREWTPTDLIDELFSLNERYKDLPIEIEDVHVAALLTAIRMEEARRGVHLRIISTPVDRTATKYDRHKRLEPRFRHGDIVFAEEIKQSIKREIVDELVRGPAARFHDFLDTLVMADTGFSPRMEKGAPVEDKTPHFEPCPDPKPRPVIEMLTGVQRELLKRAEKERLKWEKEHQQMPEAVAQ